MLNPFKHQEHYKPPNPHPPAFASEGGLEIWKCLMDLNGRMGRVEGRQMVISSVVLAVLSLVLAKTLGAF